MGVPTYLTSEKLTLRVGVPTYLYWILTPDCLPTVHLNRTPVPRTQRSPRKHELASCVLSSGNKSELAILIDLHPHTHAAAPTRATDCIPACLSVALPYSLSSCSLSSPCTGFPSRLYSSPRTLTADESDVPSRGAWSTAYRRADDHRTDDKPTISRRDERADAATDTSAP